MYRVLFWYIFRREFLLNDFYAQKKKNQCGSFLNMFAGEIPNEIGNLRNLEVFGGSIKQLSWPHTSFNLQYLDTERTSGH